MDDQLLFEQQVFGNNGASATGALSVSPAWSVGQKIGKRRIACVPRVILLSKNRNHQLSDIIDEIAIRQGQAADLISCRMYIGKQI